MNILHLDNSPRGDASLSRRLSAYLAEQLKGETHTYRDLANSPFPQLAAEDLVAIHGSTGQGTAALASHLAISDTLIAELKQADALIIGTPMHNFTIPAVLKRWIDYIGRAGLTFKYTENGPVGLTGIKTAYIILATGGAPVGGDWDFASGYLTHICKFFGVETVHVIDAGGSKREPEKIIARAKARIDELVQEQVMV